MAIRFYINGTQGGKDGTEVTAANPIVADGLFPSPSAAATKKVNVYIRADEGESYNQVYYGSVLADYTKLRVASTPTANSQMIEIRDRAQELFLLKKVTDTNTEITLLFSATADETGTVDTSLYFYAIPCGITI